MTSADPDLGKFNITARLFKLVGEMPKDQQLILLKQLVGDGVSSHLYKLIVEMTEEQQIILLEQMQQLPQESLPEKMVSLEVTEASMRENQRKPCLINTNYRIQDNDFKSYILDVSMLPNRTEPFTFSGKIAWSGPRGFGVKFDNVNPIQADVLKAFIEQND
jgi:hypothetical protein